jgi:triacylglycerol lipase
VPPTSEQAGWSRLTAAVADEVLVGTVRDMHRAISDGAYRWMGPPARPIKRITDEVTGRVYDMVSATIRGVGEIGAAAAEGFGEPTTVSTPASDKARAIAHGVVGAGLIATAPELDTDLTLYHDGGEVATDTAALREAFPDAAGRIVVFVHGLVDTEAVWFLRNDAGPALPDVVASTPDVTPVLVRYGTGRSIGRNGQDLAERLQDLVDNWPVPVTELVLVGHSMGGLVIRSATTTGVVAGHRWPSVLDDVVYLGTPHLGSWLEKVANAGSWVLRHVSPQSAPIGTLLDGRSRGIKDLRFGMLADDGWADAPIDDLLTGRVPDVPWLGGVTHHLVVGRLRASDRHPLNHLFGDSLVRAGSASGVGRRRRIEDDGNVRIVPVSARHTHLVRTPEVADLLTEILAAP